MSTIHKIQNGIYLVIDPSMPLPLLLQKLEIVLQQGLSAVQIWDNFCNTENISTLISSICTICKQYKTPVLINNKWELLKQFDLDGVHFDVLPKNIVSIKEQIGREFICGITCNNNIDVVLEANRQQLNYVSFCSMFPSTTSNSCELVSFETVQKASELTDLPIFLAGGIKPENIDLLHELHYNGIAVVSGIMSAENPAEITKQYLQKIKAHL